MAPPGNEINPNIGYWGPTTSTLDWCESNYEVSYYMAEFWNTITNLFMILAPVKCIYEVYRQKFESRYAYLYLLIMLTGIGSWMFHMTLLYEMQLLDELPMVWGSCYMVYVHYKVQIEPKKKTWKMAVMMFLYAVIVTIVYLMNKNPIFFQGSFGLLVALLTIMDVRLNMRVKSKEGWKIFKIGFSAFLLGFLCWNIDNEFCPGIRTIRSQLNPLGLSPVTQLHGWWHILVGYGNHLHIQAKIFHRQKFLGDDVELKVTLLGLEAMRKENKDKQK